MTTKTKAKTKSSGTKNKTEEKIEFSAEISKVLKLMIHSLYTNKDIFLRELVSNASDACDKLRYEALTDSKILGDNADLEIIIKSDKDTNTIEISDNGIGMNRDDLIANLGTIARSGTLEFFDKLSKTDKKDSSQIGQFGVGFYSAFMVADKVVVTSKKAGEKTAWRWESEGDGSFIISEITDSKDISRGTNILIYLKDEESEYADKFRINHIVSTYSDHIAFPIKQIEVGTDSEAEAEIINDGSAVWTKPSSEISAEQYTEFYHHISHSPDEPYLTLHNKVEGVVEYINLLFIPSMKPFDLFHPERRSQVKLYVKRVFITDENASLIPAYLRFVRGVVDSSDLPLNISRETLQDNPVMKKIRESITSRVLTELAKKAKKDVEGYAKFWSDFGAVLKEGLCEALLEKEKEKLLKVCRFNSTNGNEITSFDDYVSRMKPEQKEIYFLTGDSLESLRKSPQIEGFTSRGIEVLLLSDHVDDFWVNTVREVSGKSLKSIIRVEENLDEITGEKSNDDKADDENKTEKSSDEINNLISLLKGYYGEEIKEVRTTSKLTETPVCLGIGAGDMDMRMERFMAEHRQLPKRAAKILEINPKHELIKLLAKKVSKDGSSELIENAARMLLDQAKIIEGETIDDATQFAKRLSFFMQEGLKSAA